ncbi:hypothetical protein [Mucilaginibacter sp. SJ]|nr:hypothetical protein [Mucilaginibacter sp. SJ]WEA00436.1 hypothetical protein MusilaSJ_23550 [Mucilaginibacter sp. SJ]
MILIISRFPGLLLEWRPGSEHNTDAARNKKDPPRERIFLR